MPCPYFLPTRRISEATGIKAEAMPLGGTFAGECFAPGHERWQPGEQLLRSCCNSGYAEGECDRFPSDAEADAVRFLIQEDDGRTMQIAYVLERRHYPAGQGSIESPGTGGGLLLRTQAEAYARAYRERQSA
ncbi:MAG: hypothetical protein SFV54_09930 [Bryobacteraceae bacterium]|nr:hypothetical protein [Bryobacteraceae bacterium]